LFEDAFEWIFHQVKQQITLPRHAHMTTTTRYHQTNTMLEPRTRLLMVLHWLRHYPRYNILQDYYQVSKSYITRDITHIIPILYSKLHLITLPDPQQWPAIGRFHTHAAVDGTAHYRWRVHPGQSYYYRGDKHAHMLAAQITVTRLPRKLVHVAIGLGHNND